MKESNMELNRKALADIAVHDPEAFKAIVEEAVN
jgi:ribosomal protein L20